MTIVLKRAGCGCIILSTQVPAGCGACSLLLLSTQVRHTPPPLACGEAWLMTVWLILITVATSPTSLPLLPTALSSILLPGESREFQLDMRLCPLPRGLLSPEDSDQAPLGRARAHGGIDPDGTQPNTPAYETLRSLLISHGEGACFGQCLVMPRGSVYDVLPVLKVTRWLDGGNKVRLSCVGRSRLRLPLQTMQLPHADERVATRGSYTRYDPLPLVDRAASDESDDEYFQSFLALERLYDSCTSLASRARPQSTSLLPDLVDACLDEREGRIYCRMKWVLRLSYAVAALLPPEQRVAALSITDRRKRREQVVRALSDLERRLAAEAALQEWDASRTDR